ncbi:hypothetical protein Nepgr_017263 [Nepenthes gracilis]|uniref:Uncharacterized protein n=1 Tax=Nepenthes gracilis TaxID=150966 RepID=A0AAD3SS36_NEPGR|nr:hypothetical protein Nepgr_017263 [Nepenthes gracilis]
MLLGNSFIVPDGVQPVRYLALAISSLFVQISAVKPYANAAAVLRCTLFTSCWKVLRWYDLIPPLPLVMVVCNWLMSVHLVHFCGRGPVCCLHLSWHVLRNFAGWYWHPVGVEALLRFMLWKLPLTRVNGPLMGIANTMLIEAIVGNAETGSWSLADAGGYSACFMLILQQLVSCGN